MESECRRREEPRNTLRVRRVEELAELRAVADRLDDLAEGRDDESDVRDLHRFAREQIGAEPRRSEGALETRSGS